MAVVGGIILQGILIAVYLLLFFTDFWQRVSPYLAGIISGLAIFSYIQDHQAHKMAHSVAGAVIFMAIVETLLIQLLKVEQLKIPATYLCLSVNIMFLMAGTSSIIQRHTLAHCTISVFLYFAMAFLILYLSTSEDWGDGLLCPMRRTWGMRILAAVINTAASLILCFDPMMMLNGYCMEQCTASQQDKINTYIWLGLGFAAAFNIILSLVSDWWKWKKACSASGK